jgi:hypothetical protein
VEKQKAIFSRAVCGARKNKQKNISPVLGRAAFGKECPVRSAKNRYDSGAAS